MCVARVVPTRDRRDHESLAALPDTDGPIRPSRFAHDQCIDLRDSECPRPGRLIADLTAIRVPEAYEANGAADLRAASTSGSSRSCRRATTSLKYSSSGPAPRLQSPQLGTVINFGRGVEKRFLGGMWSRVCAGRGQYVQMTICPQCLSLDIHRVSPLSRR